MTAEQKLESIRCELERAIAAGKPHTGMQVPYHGPLASVVHLPSVQRDLQWWLQLVTLEK